MTAPVNVNPGTATTTIQRRSRRALLVGALGGLGAWAASAVGRATPVRAEGETMVVGGEYTTATSRTRLRNQSNAADVFRAESSSTATAVWGVSSSGIGVQGESTSGIGAIGSSTSGTGALGFSSSWIGVHGINSATAEPAIVGESRGNSSGLLGVSQSGLGSLPAAKPRTGVFGYANQGSSSTGVWGFSGQGVGVYGQANQNGIAVRASGRIKADKVSGVATIPAGNTGVTVTPNVNVTPGAFVLLTPMANIGSRGLWFTTNASADTFRIRMSSVRSSNTKVAWLLLG